MFDFYDTEACHLSEIEDDYDYDEENIVDEIEDNELDYIHNKRSKVGTVISCAGPLCNKRFTKKSYQQAFCCSKCKDKFWNRREAYFGYKKSIKI